MVDDDKVPHLVEMNTIASGLGAISDQMPGFYEYICSKYETSIRNASDNMPTDSKNVDGIVDSFKQAYDLYCSEKPDSTRRKILAYMIDYKEANICDQRLLENALFKKHKIVSRRLTFRDISENCVLTETGELLFKDSEEIAVVYYRTGYSPSQYKDEQDWEARKLLEVSQAIKCPNVDLQLLTFKKIQEALADENVWNKIMDDKYANIKNLFIDKMFGLDDLDNPKTQSIIEDAINRPDDFVLKTQREGGGNNYFGSDIADILTQGEDLHKYSLMRKIYPKQFEGDFLRRGKVYHSKCVSEIGIFGTLIVKYNAESPEILLNKDTGFLLRTKGANTNEGGVYCGYSFIDYPSLS